MKKILSFLSLALLLCFACCKPEENYYESIDAELDAMSTFYNELQKDTSLTEDQMDDQIHTRWEEAKERLAAITSRALAKHNNDSVAVDMIQAMAALELTDKEGLAKAIDALGPEAAADSSIIELREYCRTEEKAPEGSMFVDFAIEQPSGKTLRLSDFAGKGKYCLVDFWASWCGPCKREIPNIKAVYDKYSKKGLVVVSVAVWDRPEDSEAAAKELGITWNQIVNAQKIPTDLYGINGIPHILLIGPDGTILKRDLRGSDIAKTVEKYL